MGIKQEREALDAMEADITSRAQTLVIERREVIAELVPGPGGEDPLSMAMQIATEYMRDHLVEGQGMTLEWTIGDRRFQVTSDFPRPVVG